MPLKASIIISNYNYGRFLADAIESAIGQSWSDVEVFVIDDGSTDESLEVLARYVDRVIPIIKDNGGQASGFNLGFSRSTGDVIYFLDSDDVLEPNCVAETITWFEYPAVVKVHWPMTIVDGAGKPTGEMVDRSPPSGFLADRVVKLGPANHQTPPTSGNAWARWALERVMPIPEQAMRNWADSFLFALVPFHGAMTTVEIPLSRYRKHDANISTVTSANELISRWEDRAICLQLHLAEYGIETSIDRWRNTNRYIKRLQGVDIVKNHIDRWVPRDSPFLWLGRTPLSTAEICPHHRVELPPLQPGQRLMDTDALAFLSARVGTEPVYVGMPGRLYRPRRAFTESEAFLSTVMATLVKGDEVMLFGPKST